MRLAIGWVLLALVLAACEGSGDAPAAADTTPEVTETTGAAVTTRPLYSDADDSTETPTPTDSAPGQGAEAAITIENFSFGAPSTVGVGDPLLVVNEDGVPHTWTADDGTFDSGTLGSGESFEYSFDEAGEYSFFCEIHPGMTGTITVTG